MKSRIILAVAAVLGISLAIAPAVLRTPSARAAAHGISVQGLNHIQRAHLSGFASFEAGIGVPTKAPAARAGARMSNAGVNLCPRNLGSNVKVNQNCLNVTDPDLQGRGQAQNETWPSRRTRSTRANWWPGYNDYRRGDGTCGAVVLSGNGGRKLDRHAPCPTGSPAAPPSATARAVLAGRRRHVGGLGHPRQRLLLLPGVHARAGHRPTTPTSPARSTCSGPPATNGASWNFPGRPAVEHVDVAGAGTSCTTSRCMTVDNSPHQPVPGPDLRDLDDVRRRRHRLHLRGALRRLRRDLQRPGRGQHEQRAVRQHLRPADAAGHLQREPVLRPVHRARRHPLRGLRQLQQRGHRRSDNHNQMLLAKSTDGGQTFCAPVTGGRLQRPAGLRHLPGRRRRRPGLRAGEGHRAELDLPGDQLPRSARSTRANPSQVVVTYGSYINRNSNESNGCTPAGFAAAGTNLYTGVKTPAPATTRSSCQRLQQRRGVVHRHHRRSAADAGGQHGPAAGSAPTSCSSGPPSPPAEPW